MEIKDLEIKEKLDLMKKNGLDSITFRKGDGVDLIEFELCYFIDPPEESLSLSMEGKRLIHAWDRDYFEELLGSLKLDL